MYFLDVCTFRPQPLYKQQVPSPVALPVAGLLPIGAHGAAIVLFCEDRLTIVKHYFFSTRTRVPLLVKPNYLL